MGWDEKLFGVLYRVIKRQKTATAPSACTLEPLRARLHLFGACVAGQKIEIGAAERNGRRCGVTLLLPGIIALAPTRDANERAYLLRVAIDATALRLGLEPARALDDLERSLFALVSIPRVLEALDQDLPGARELMRELGPLAVAIRPSLARLPPRAVTCEVLTRHCLGVAWADLQQQTSAALVEQARAVHERALLDPASSMDLVATLREGLRASDLQPVVLWGATAHAGAARSAATAAPGKTADSSGTERRGPPREGVRVVTLDETQIEDNPITHSFEKVHTAEEYSGGKKSVDGADELSAQGEALDEIEMREVVRSRERALSLYRAEVDFESDPGGGEVADDQLRGGLAYDEWDERQRRYLEGHCRVFVSTAARPVDAASAFARVRAVVSKNARQIRELEARFERIERARRERARQRDGTDVDVDGMVERHGSLAAGHTGEDRLYVARRPTVQDLAVLVLIDASLSADAWVGGRRVLDVAKDAVIVLGEALARLPVQAGVAAFFSNTRRDCRFVVVKEFGAAWEPALTRLASVTPTAYTRIGPALRHGARLLEDSGARKKLLIMIGDGKPTDFDRYEGRHGVGDVRQAVREAQQRGVDTFALAIDTTARPQLQQMFGVAGFERLARPEDLAAALGRVCADLAR